MNTVIAEVGADQGFADGRGILHEGVGIACFIAVGLIFLLAAGRLCRRVRGPVHAHSRYTSPRL